MPNSRHNAAMQLPALLASMTNRIRSSDICTRFHGIPFTLLLAFLPHKKCQGCPVTKCQGCHETEHFSLPTPACGRISSQLLSEGFPEVPSPRYPGQPPAPRTFSSTSFATAAVFAWIV